MKMIIFSLKMFAFSEDVNIKGAGEDEVLWKNLQLLPFKNLTISASGLLPEVSPVSFVRYCEIFKIFF